MHRILIVDDDESYRQAVVMMLPGIDFHVTAVKDGREAVAKLNQSTFDIVLSDLRMPHVDGLGVLAAARERAHETPVVIMTAQGTVDDAINALRAGAMDFLIKPFDVEQLHSVLHGALEYRKVGPKGRARAPGRPQAALVGTSTLLKEVLGQVNLVAPTDATVLLTGESGTGKEVISRLVHGASRRSAGPFIAINCGAIPAELMEGELFGHGRGAFTGAAEARVGRFQQADGGTIFLDEVGELPPPLQVKLLRVLQEREITPLGLPTRTVDVRVVAATNRDLEKAVAERQFREDLYYRLAVVPLHLPPLRDRGEDILLLAEHFLDHAGRRHGRSLTLSKAAAQALLRYRWPGNVRELENLIERLSILTTSDAIEVQQLPPKIRDAAARPAHMSVELPECGLDLVATLAAIERDLIDTALRRSDGNKTRAAELLGLNRSTLGEKLRRFNDG